MDTEYYSLSEEQIESDQENQLEGYMLLCAEDEQEGRDDAIYS